MARVLLCLDGNVIKEVRLVRDRTTVGRRPSNDIQIENLAVSGEHAMFNRVGRDVFIEDLGSTNGTLVNGKPVQRQLLNDGDEIVVGKYQLKFWQDADGGEDFEKTMMLQAPTRPIPPPAPRAAAVVTTRPSTAPVATRPAAAQPAPRPAAPSVSVPAAAQVGGPMGVVKVLTGPNIGREVLLNKPATTLGRAGAQVAVISKRQQGYVLVHVEGERTPLVNGRDIGTTAQPLRDEDLIELMGVKMAFFIRD